MRLRASDILVRRAASRCHEEEIRYIVLEHELQNITLTPTAEALSSSDSLLDLCPLAWDSICIHNNVRELPGSNTFLEEDIHLLERPVLRLW